LFLPWSKQQFTETITYAMSSRSLFITAFAVVEVEGVIGIFVAALSDGAS